ncbi:hypothetical protein TNCV_483661 [Trichonephila clavipes]|nr:hypothetical protein TNCV_483661 [Trichonephila clavipes]
MPKRSTEVLRQWLQKENWLEVKETLSPLLKHGERILLSFELSENSSVSNVKTVADEVRSLMEELPCLLRFDWSRPIDAESGRGKELGRSENKRPETRRDLGI